MADYSKKQGTSLWVWLVIALIVAALTVGVLYYIGWFDARTHVDTPAGDNVEQQYQITETDASAPGEADWQNAGHESLREVITEHASDAQQ